MLHVILPQSRVYTEVLFLTKWQSKDYVFKGLVQTIESKKIVKVYLVKRLESTRAYIIEAQCTQLYIQ